MLAALITSKKSKQMPMNLKLLVKEECVIGSWAGQAWARAGVEGADGQHTSNNNGEGVTAGKASVDCSNYSNGEGCHEGSVEEVDVK